MRNLAKYPLTAAETVDMLTRASDKAAEHEVPGDMLPMTLKEAAGFIKANAAQFETFLRTKAEEIARQVAERRG